MNCPKCSKSMKPVSYEGIEVDRCSGCGALWFDALEDRDLKKVKGAAEALDTGKARTASAQDEHGKRNCPKCGTRMIRMVDSEQPHIWYESCPVCYGKFFDAGEFRDLSERSIGDLFKHWRKGERKLD